MRRLASTMLLVLCVSPPAFATWSVIALDRTSGAVVIASATCVAQRNIAGFPARDLRDIQAIVVPGKGVAAAQAGVDRTRANQKLIFAELEKGTDPARILERLREDPNIESRQFGILDMEGRHANFDGAKNAIASLHEAGRVPGTSVWYSIQGNILASDNVVHAAAAAFEVTRGTLADRVMAAMEAADGRGGDRRCTCDSAPKVDAPCDAKTAHVAYILQADRGDSDGESFNDGRYAMYIGVTNDDIEPTENANPVKTLRMRYDAWKRAHSRPREAHAARRR